MTLLSEPWAQAGRHYIKDIVFAANDRIVTTFAVVAGVRGAGFSLVTVLALGFANLAADGLSMAVGNYLGIKSERAAELGDGYFEGPESAHTARHAAVTWASIASAGIIPLLPYFLPLSPDAAFAASTVCGALALFSIGMLRKVITLRPPWRSGLEMLLVGAVAGTAAFAAGWCVEAAAGG